MPTQPAARSPQPAVPVTGPDGPMELDTLRSLFLHVGGPARGGLIDTWVVGT
jgi:hypothetical protein